MRDAPLCVYVLRTSHATLLDATNDDQDKIKL